MNEKYYLINLDIDNNHEVRPLTKIQKAAHEDWEESSQILAADIDWFITEDVPYGHIISSGFVPKVPAAGKWVCWSGTEHYFDCEGNKVDTAEEVIENLYSQNKITDEDVKPYRQNIIDADELLENIGRVY
jgi:hypothetical protein